MVSGEAPESPDEGEIDSSFSAPRPEAGDSDTRQIPEDMAEGDLDLPVPPPLDLSPDEDIEENAPTGSWQPHPEKLLQALVFASPEYLHFRTLREIMGEQWDAAKLRQLVRSVNNHLIENEEPFEIVEINSSLRFRTLTQFYPWVRKLFKDANPRRLSQASLETLAIVAYKQPITKAEIEAIRGVNVDGALKNLLDKKLIDISGKAETVGTPFTYSSTKEFLRYFGINKVPEDLPRLSELEEIIQAQALLPQISGEGEINEEDQPEPDPNQISLDIDS